MIDHISKYKQERRWRTDQEREKLKNKKVRTSECLLHDYIIKREIFIRGNNL